MNIDNARRSTAARSSRGLRTLITLGLVAALFLPMGYMCVRFWSSTREAAEFVSAEQHGVRYVRAVTGLLAELSAAQSAAVRSKTVDVAAVRSSVEDVDQLNRRYGDPLQIQQRWDDLAKLIETTLKQNAKEKQALTSYAGPIGLTQSLLAQIGDASKVVRDPGLDAYHLMDTALARLPEVVVSGGEVGSLAPALAGADRPQATVSRVAVAQDRLTKATEAINVGLRTGADATASDSLGRSLLRPLDEFVAAVDAMGKASTALTHGQGTTPGEIEAAQKRVHEAALALDSAVLTELDSLLDQRSDDLAADRRTALVATVLGALAGLLLLWLLLPTTPTSRAPAVAVTDASAHRDGRPQPDGGALRPARAAAEGDLVDARALLGPELVRVGRGVRPKHRLQPDDPR